MSEPRLDRIMKALGGRYVLLHRLRVKSAADDLDTQIRCDGTLRMVAELQLDDDPTPSDVMIWAESHGLREQTVNAFWVSYQDWPGFRLRLCDFLLCYDDLWYPGDDVWITDDAHSWVLEFDHEEVLRLYRGVVNQGA